MSIYSKRELILNSIKELVTKIDGKLLEAGKVLEYLLDKVKDINDPFENCGKIITEDEWYSQGDNSIDYFYKKFEEGYYETN